MSNQLRLNLADTYQPTLDSERSAYLRFHQNRFKYLIKEVNRLALICKHVSQSIRILDIGPHFQTTLIRETLGPSAIINSLGWEIGDPIVPQGVVNQHYTFDLNDSPYPDRWIDAPQHDIIVMAEVFEHLHTAPEYFLGYLRTLLKPCGYLLIGTPNAVSLSRRAHIVIGNNPYEKIRITINNPGHFREYTIKELEEYALLTGFTVESSTFSDFYPASALSSIIKRCVPTMRDCIHIVLKKTTAPDAPTPLTFW
ncbi:methyltransferase domain-containing protein [Spirosoma gilvum]